MLSWYTCSRSRGNRQTALHRVSYWYRENPPPQRWFSSCADHAWDPNREQIFLRNEKAMHVGLRINCTDDDPRLQHDVRSGYLERKCNVAVQCLLLCLLLWQRMDLWPEWTGSLARPTMNRAIYMYCINPPNSRRLCNFHIHIATGIEGETIQNMTCYDVEFALLSL